MRGMECFESLVLGKVWWRDGEEGKGGFLGEDGRAFEIGYLYIQYTSSGHLRPLDPKQKLS